MNLKSIEYIVKIEEEKSVTRAAQKLFITPSALNQHLLHLEEEIGTPLFYRARSGWTPTEAGQVYLETAKEMLRMKRETWHRLQDIVKIRRGSLVIGFPPERSTVMFQQIYPLFHQEYPDMTVRVVEANVRKQQEMIGRGELDIGFMTLGEHQKTEDEYIKIGSEELVLVIPEGHPAEQKSKKQVSPYPELELKHLCYEPFALMNRESTLYDIVSRIFDQAGFQPNVLFETARARTILEMSALRLCCGIVPNSPVVKAAPGVRFFSLPEHPTWSIYVSYKKNSYLSKPAMRFVELAMELF